MKRFTTQSKLSVNMSVVRISQTEQFIFLAKIGWKLEFTDTINILYSQAQIIMWVICATAQQTQDVKFMLV